MLASLNDVMPVLEQRKVCLAGFDGGGGQVDFVLGVLRACEAARCPAMFLLWPGHSYQGMEATANLVGFYAERASVPVVLHLDHGSDEATVEKALKLGLRSVMFDGSALPFAENLRRTKEMVKLARSFGASIEGELGSVGNEHGTESVRGELTDVAEAEKFVKETGIDLFAPSVGNAHGFYHSPPMLRFDLVEELRQRCAVPLSMHGGTGLSMDDLRKAASLGVRKLNIATLLHKTYTDALRSVAARVDKPANWHEMLMAGRKGIGEVVTGYIDELGLRGLV